MKSNQVIISVVELLTGNISLFGGSRINVILKPKKIKNTGKTEEILS